MKYKLLNRTLLFYLVFSSLVVLIAAPVFYLSIQRLFKHEADEVLFLHKDEFMKSNYPGFPEKKISLWNEISRDIKILPYDARLMRDSLADELIYDSLDNELVPYRALFSPIRIEGQPKIYMARESLIESDALIRNIAKIFCIILILLLAGLFFITRFLSTRLWKPFFSTITQLEQFELDKNTVPTLMETNVDEFDRLNNAAKKLLEKNLLVFKSQKEFIENAAHELQTPIATLLAKLDVMVQELPMTHELGEALTSLHESASRIIRLNKNLLLLSKIENDQFAAYEKVTVSSIVEKQSNFIKEQMQQKGVMLKMSTAGPLVVSANVTLLEIAIGNLMLNALKHNIPDGEILVRLDERRLRISNSGLSPLLNQDQLFQRFSTTGSSGGSGLGLAIVKKISDQHGWTLSYSFAEHRHNFELIFLNF